MRAALGLAAGAATAVVYRGGLDNPFVFDDRATVLLNPAFETPWDFAAALRDVPYPAVSLTYAIDRAFWGFSSLGFHIGNASLHIVVVGLLYGWCTRTLADRERPEWPAFFAAALFGLHPLMSAAAGYVSARGEILAAAGFLGALTFARRAIVRSSLASAAMAAVSGLLAIASNAAALALPIVILVYDAWVLDEPGWRRRAARAYAPAIGAAVALAWWWHAGDTRVDAIAPAGGPLARVLTASVIVWRDLALLIAPYGQSPVHDARVATSAADPIALAAFAALAALVAAAIALRRIAPLVAFGVVWFVGTLVPVCAAVVLREGMAEYRLYLPAVGLVLAAAAALARPIARRYTVRLVGYGVLIACALATARRNHAWSEPVDAWREAARREPRAWQVRFQFAESLRESGACDAAIAEYAAALRLNPRFADAAAGREACAAATRQPRR
jgi:protein O-mannosyl-transferase